MPMYPCKDCLENSWSFRNIEDDWIAATCDFCGTVVEFEPKKKALKKVLTPEEPCPRCGLESLAWKCHKPGWKPKTSQPYWFDRWIKCDDCGFVQMFEEYKRFHGE